VELGPQASIGMAGESGQVQDLSGKKRETIRSNQFKVTEVKVAGDIYVVKQGKVILSRSGGVRTARLGL
jgi:hypothetical protein